MVPLLYLAVLLVWTLYSLNVHPCLHQFPSSMQEPENTIKYRILNKTMSINSYIFNSKSLHQQFPCHSCFLNIIITVLLCIIMIITVLEICPLLSTSTSLKIAFTSISVISLPSKQLQNNLIFERKMDRLLFWVSVFSNLPLLTLPSAPDQMLSSLCRMLNRKFIINCEREKKTIFLWKAWDNQRSRKASVVLCNL